MVVLHDLIHSSRVHQDFVGEVQVSFLLASRSAINSPYSFEVEFAFLRCSQLFRHWLWYNFTSSFELFLITPHQAYSFVIDFLNNSVQPFLLSSCHSILSILPKALCCSSRQGSSHLVKFRSLFLPFSAGVLPKLFHSYSFSILF